MGAFSAQIIGAQLLIQVRPQLCNIHVQRTVEAQRCRKSGDDLHEQTVQVDECDRRPNYDGEYNKDPRCQTTHRHLLCTGKECDTHTEPAPKYMSVTLQHVSPATMTMFSVRQGSQATLNLKSKVRQACIKASKTHPQIEWRGSSYRRPHVVDILRYNIRCPSSLRNPHAQARNARTRWCRCGPRTSPHHEALLLTVDRHTFQKQTVKNHNHRHIDHLVETAASSYIALLSPWAKHRNPLNVNCHTYVQHV